MTLQWKIWKSKSHGRVNQACKHYTCGNSGNSRGVCCNDASQNALQLSCYVTGIIYHIIYLLLSLLFMSISHDKFGPNCFVLLYIAVNYGRPRRWG